MGYSAAGGVLSCASQERTPKVLLEFRATDEQVLAGILLYRGEIVEMTAGEGKTIAAVFPAVMHTLLAGRFTSLHPTTTWRRGIAAYWPRCIDPWALVWTLC